MKKIVLVLLLIVSSHSKETVEVNEKEASGKWAGIPAISLSEETGVQLGGLVMYFAAPEKDFDRNSNYAVSVLASLKNQWKGVFFSDLYPSNDVRVKPKLRFRYWPTSYYGVGNETNDSDEQKFLAKEYVAETTVEKKINSKLWLGTGYKINYENISWNDEAYAESVELIGEGGTLTSGLKLSISYDARDHHNYPRSGYLVGLSGSWNAPLLGSKVNFTESEMKMAYYFPVGEEGVFAIGAQSQVVTGEVPFRRLVSPDGVSKLRGFEAGKIRSRKLVSLQSEYRTPVWWKLGTTVYYDVAQVASEWGGISLKEFHQSPGIGIRYAFNQGEKFNVRLDISYVDFEGICLTIEIQEAF